MVGARGVAEGRPDPAEALGDEVPAGEPLVGRVPRAPRLLVQPFRERLGEPVGERLDHDRAVVVAFRLEGGRELVGAVDPDREPADVVVEAGFDGSHEVRERAVRTGVAVRSLLTQHREADAAVSRREHDVVALGRGPPEPLDAARRQELLLDDPVEQRVRRIEEVPCRMRPSRDARGSRGSAP